MMSEPKITKGSWRAGKPHSISDQRMISGDDGQTIAVVYGVSPGDADLLAAAKELRDVLSNILYAHETDNNGAAMGEAMLCQAFASQARAALAKARGES